MKQDELRTALEGAGIRPSKGYGQNFLIDENLALAIARDGAEGARDDVVLEVGTGPGILTEHLLPRAYHVVTVEVDPRLAALARARLGAASNLTLVEADALASKSELAPAMLEAVRARLGDAGPGGRMLRVCANLPYAVATPLVIGLLAAALPLRVMVVMVQLEAAERFAADVGQAPYGAVSVLCRALCQRVSIIRKVPPEVFWPRPKVTSAVVRFEPRPERQQGHEALEAVVRGLFNYRRKTLAKAARLASEADPSLAWLEQAVATSGLDGRARTEDLALRAFQKLAELSPERTGTK